jgi:hypothetical protein
MSKCPINALGRSVCAQTLADNSLALGAEVHVSTLPPLVAGPYEEAAFECPHGVTFWIEPTGEQVADWAARQVP